MIGNGTADGKSQQGRKEAALAQEIATDKNWGAEAFPLLTPEHREKIQPYVTQVSFKPGDKSGGIICKEGAKGDTMYFIEFGNGALLHTRP